MRYGIIRNISRIIIISIIRAIGRIYIVGRVTAIGRIYITSIIRMSSRIYIIGIIVVSSRIYIVSSIEVSSITRIIDMIRIIRTSNMIMSIRIIRTLGMNRMVQEIARRRRVIPGIIRKKLVRRHSLHSLISHKKHFRQIWRDRFCACRKSLYIHILMGTIVKTVNQPRLWRSFHLSHQRLRNHVLQPVKLQPLPLSNQLFLLRIH